MANDDRNSEFCADDAEEAQFRVQHTASSSGSAVEPHPLACLACDDPEAVMLDFM